MTSLQPLPVFIVQRKPCRYGAGAFGMTIVLIWCLGAAPVQGQSTIQFAKETASVAATNTGNSQGASWVDIDNDDDLDLYVVNVAAQINFLYLNEGGTLTRMTAGQAATDAFSSIGNCWADIDNDGDLDVFASGSPSALYLNDGLGLLTRANNLGTFGTTDLRGWACAWGDYDLDGYVDLIVTHPAGFVGTPVLSNLLFRNNGDATFERITDTPISANTAPFTVATWSDYDTDGDPDLFIGSGPATATPGLDFLYKNMLKETGAVSFERITEGALATRTRDGQVINWIDYDNDRDLDAFVTNWGGGMGGLADELYRNDGGELTRITEGALVSDQEVSLASVWADFDNDADLDVFVADGSSARTSRLYENNGDGTFTRLEIAPFNTDRNVSWGASAGDFDDDGDLDLFIANAQNGSRNFFYRNELDAANHWLRLRLVGTASNRAAIGARVRIKSGVGGQAVWQLREVSSQNSFNGHNSLFVHFGLAQAAVVDSLQIEWPSGQVDVYSNLDADRFLVVTEGESVSPVAVGEAAPLPVSIELQQNFPNPFRTATLLGYRLPVATAIDVSIYDLRGVVVRRLESGVRPAGVHSVTWDGKNDAGNNMASGVYFFRLQAGPEVFIRKMVKL